MGSQIRRRELAGNLGRSAFREDALIPRKPAFPVAITAEEIDLLARHADVGVLVQAGVQPRGPGTLGADADEIGRPGTPSGSTARLESHNSPGMAGRLCSPPHGG